MHDHILIPTYNISTCIDWNTKYGHCTIQQMRQLMYDKCLQPQKTSIPNDAIGIYLLIDGYDTYPKCEYVELRAIVPRRSGITLNCSRYHATIVWQSSLLDTDYEDNLQHIRQELINIFQVLNLNIDTIVDFQDSIWLWEFSMLLPITGESK